MFNFANAKQKVLVKYENELKPFTINNLWDNEGNFISDTSDPLRSQKEEKENR